MTTTAPGAVRPSLTRQASWLLLAKTAGFALTFALPMLLVRTLTQHEFGVYKQAFLIVQTALTVLPLGFGMTAFYFLPRETGRGNAVVVHVLAVYATVGGLAALALWRWPQLLAAAFGSGDLAAYGPLIGAIILTWVVASFLEIIPVACGDIRASTGFIMGSQASKALLFLVASLAFGSVGSLLYAALAQGIGQIGVLLLYLRWKFPGYWKAFDWRFLRRQASYGVPIGVSALLLRTQLDLPHYFLAHHFGASVYAIYAVGVFNLPLIGLLRESVGSVMLPRVSQLELANNTRHIVELLSRVCRKLALIYFPLYVLLMIVGRDFITLLFTKQYAGSWPIFAVNLTLIPFGALVLDPVTKAFASQRYFVLKLRVAILAATTLALVFGTAALGPLGVVTLVVFMQVVAVCVSAWKLARVMGAGRRELGLFSGVGRIAVAAVLAGVPCVLVRQGLSSAAPITVLLTCGAVFVVSYAACVLALNVLNDEERGIVRRFFPRRLRAALPQGSGW